MHEMREENAMNRNTALGLAVSLMVCMSFTGFAQNDAAEAGNIVRGNITSITVDDPSHSKGVRKDVGRYAVRIEIDSVDDVLLGFGESNKPLGAQQAMLDLLMLAVKKELPVLLTLHRDLVSGSKQRSHARIVSVTVKP